MMCPFLLSVRNPSKNSVKFKILSLFLLFFLSLSVSSQTDSDYENLSKVIENFTKKKLDASKIKKASEAKSLTPKIVQISQSYAAFNEVGKTTRYKGGTFYEKCLYHYRRYWSKKSYVESSEKQLDKEKENMRNATSTYESNLYKTRYNNLAAQIDDMIEDANKAADEHNNCDRAQKRKIKSAETTLKRYLNDFVKDVESYDNTSIGLQKNVSSSSEKEYGMMIIQELAKKGDASAKKVVTNGSSEKKGPYTFFIDRGSDAQLFVSYKIVIPDRTIFVVRRLNQYEQLSTLIAMEDASNSKTGKAGLTYYDPIITGEGRRSSICLPDGKRKLPESTHVETIVIYKDANLEETSSLNATYYEVEDIIQYKDVEKYSGSTYNVINELYSIVERRNFSDRILVAFIIQDESEVVYEDELYHTNYIRKN